MSESDFPSLGRPYQKVNRHFSDFDMSTTLINKQNQLLALLYAISAEGAEVFTKLPESIQSMYLLACTDMAQDCVDLSEALGVG